MTTSLTPTELRDTVAMLSSPPLIRLITEIDDNGPIPPRGLARTLPDLSSHQLRQATDMARTLGLLHVCPGAGLSLSTAGSELADVYDATARWARNHAYPNPISDFTTRVHHTLDFLAPQLLPATATGLRPPVDDHLSSARADANPDWPGDLLRQWLDTNSQAVRPAAASDLAA